MTTFDPIKIARDLTEICDLAADLLTQAVADANATIDGHSLPGGLAMVALAPVADIATWERRVEIAEAAWAQVNATRDIDGWPAGLDPTDRPDLASDEDDSWEPALQTLRFWSDHYRRVHQQDWDHTPTLVTEAKYLRHHLEWIVTHEPNADVFAADVNLTRPRLETVLTAGRRPERTRVECTNPTCENPRQLIKTYGRRYVVAHTCRTCDTTLPDAHECQTCHHVFPASARQRCTRLIGSKADRRPCDGELTSVTRDVDRCPNPWCGTIAPPAPQWASDTADDRWKCTSCKTRYDLDDYLDAHAQQMRRESAARFVWQADAIATLVAQGTSKSTVMRWLRCPIEHTDDRCTLCARTWPPSEHAVCPGVVVTASGRRVDCGGELEQRWVGDREDVVTGYCEISTRRVWVWWPDLWRRHLAKQTKDQTRRKSA